MIVVRVLFPDPRAPNTFHRPSYTNENNLFMNEWTASIQPRRAGPSTPPFTVCLCSWPLRLFNRGTLILTPPPPPDGTARGSGGAKAGPDTVAPALEQIKVLGEKAPSRPLNSEDKASPLWPNNTGHGRLISRTGWQTTPPPPRRTTTTPTGRQGGGGGGSL